MTVPISSESKHRDDFIGASSGSTELLSAAVRLAKTALPVLIAGEVGCGKKHLAARIHASSELGDAQLIVLRCGSISFNQSLQTILSQQSTKRATIVLDGVEAMAAQAQAEIAIACDSRRADLRIVATTTSDLLTLTRNGAFREDLYYQLASAPLMIPPLRRRSDDIPDLVRHFVAKSCALDSPRSLPVTFSGEALAVMAMYSWPGNLRELESIVRRIQGLFPGTIVGTERLPPEIRFSATRPVDESVAFDPSVGIDLESEVARLERTLIERALRETHGNKQAAAQLLGLKRTTLVAKLRRLNAHPDDASKALKL